MYLSVDAYNLNIYEDEGVVVYYSNGKGNNFIKNENSADINSIAYEAANWMSKDSSDGFSAFENNQQEKVFTLAAAGFSEKIFEETQLLPCY